MALCQFLPTFVIILPDEKMTIEREIEESEVWFRVMSVKCSSVQESDGIFLTPEPPHVVSKAVIVIVLLIFRLSCQLQYVPPYILLPPWERR